MAHYQVINQTTKTPPVSPTHGDCYIPEATATGDWAGYEGQVAMAITSDDDTSHTWYFVELAEGDTVYDAALNLWYFHNGSSLQDVQDAASIAFTPTGSIVATKVATAIVEVSGDIDTHLADTTPHASEFAGTSFPGSPYDGQVFYRTDLQMGFRYFGTRAKWLSEQAEVFRLSRNASGITVASWLRRQNGADSNGAPFYAKRDGTIVEYAGSLLGTISSSDFDIGTVASLGAGSLSSVLLTITRTGTGPFGSQAADVDFTSGDMLAVQYDPTGGSDSGITPTLDFTIRWRAS